MCCVSRLCYFTDNLIPANKHNKQPLNTVKGRWAGVGWVAQSDCNHTIVIKTPRDHLKAKTSSLGRGEYLIKISCKHYEGRFNRWLRQGKDGETVDVVGVVIENAQPSPSNWINAVFFFNLPVKDLKRNPKIKVELWKDYLEFKKKARAEAICLS